MKIAIIGAGLSGLTLAHGLASKADITVFEKSKGVGGRLSTRYTDSYQFDHGAQYFTARSKAFQAFLQPFIEQGVVQEWQAKAVTLDKGKKPYKRPWFEPHYVATPKMTSLCRALAQDVELCPGLQITALTHTDTGWLLLDQSGKNHGPFNWVVSTAPSPQTDRLFPENFSDSEVLTSTKMNGCFSLMLGFETPPEIHWHAAVVKNSPIGWMAVNSSKPGRNTQFSLIVQSTNQWADENIERDTEQVQALLLDEVCALFNKPLEPDHLSLHRWKYAATEVSEEASTENGFLIDKMLRLATCGDWCIGGRVEAAFLSAHKLAKAMGTAIDS